MKYYSDVTNKVYETVDALNMEEKQILDAKRVQELAEQKKKEQREAKAKDVEAAIKAAVAAQKTATEKLEAFCKEYGVFHTSVENADMILGNLNPFDKFFKTFWGF